MSASGGKQNMALYPKADMQVAYSARYRIAGRPPKAAYAVAALSLKASVHDHLVELVNHGLETRRRGAG